MGARTILAVLAATALAAPLHAQSTLSNDLPKPPWQSISAGQTVNGTLSTSDFKRPDNSYADVFAYKARAGETVTFTLRAQGFDAWLTVDEPNGPYRESDDDSAGGTDAQMTVTFPNDGTFLIVANSVSPNATGSYTLSASSSSKGSAPAAAAPARGQSTASNDLPNAPWPSISLGQTINGTLSASDFKRPDNSYVDAFAYQGHAGETVTITMRAPGFDAWLLVDEPNGPYREHDDDSAVGTDAQLNVTLPRDGTYLIVANSVVPNTTGSYTLTLSGARSSTRKQVSQ
jgi:plastocyanin